MICRFSIGDSVCVDPDFVMTHHAWLVDMRLVVEDIYRTPSGNVGCVVRLPDGTTRVILDVFLKEML